MPYSALSHLDCPRCGTQHDADRVQGTCSCGSPLLAGYDLRQAADQVSVRDIADRPPDLWRYHELLPVRQAGHVVSLGEGMTPLLPMPKAGQALGVPDLLLKDEGLLPTGTFKARGAAVGVSRAAELGVAAIGMPTNGNAGAAWSAYAARAGMASLIAMPAASPPLARYHNDDSTITTVIWSRAWPRHGTSAAGRPSRMPRSRSSAPQESTP